MGNGGCHLPDDKVSSSSREGLAHGIKPHLPAAAENVTVIIILIGIRILSVTQGVEYQKIFHINEDTEDYTLIKISNW